MPTKFREIKVRGRYFSRVFRFANFLKSRIQEPSKIKENKVSHFIDQAGKLKFFCGRVAIRKSKSSAWYLLVDFSFKVVF